MMTTKGNCNLCTLLVGMQNVIVTFENSLAVPPRVKYRVITYIGGSLVAQTVKRLPAMWETRVRSLSQEGRSPGEGNGNRLQYSCLEKSMEGRAWWATVHGVAKNRMRLSDFPFTFHHIYDPAILLLGINPRELKTYVHTKTCI